LSIQQCDVKVIDYEDIMIKEFGVEWENLDYCAVLVPKLSDYLIKNKAHHHMIPKRTFSVRTYQEAKVAAVKAGNNVVVVQEV
jgi:hypothetical protein